MTTMNGRRLDYTKMLRDLRIELERVTGGDPCARIAYIDEPPEVHAPGRPGRKSAGKGAALKRLTADGWT